MGFVYGAVDAGRQCCNLIEARMSRLKNDFLKVMIVAGVSGT